MKIEFVNKATLKIKDVVKKSIIETLDYLGQDHKKLELCVMFVDAVEMKDLNKRTRNIDKTTDVLSFPSFSINAGELLGKKMFMHEDDVHLGDMAICLSQAEAQAKEYNQTLESEVSKLAVHGTLHLMGYDHIKDEDFMQMQPVEDAVAKILKTKKII